LAIGDQSNLQPLEQLPTVTPVQSFVLDKHKAEPTPPRNTQATPREARAVAAYFHLPLECPPEANRYYQVINAKRKNTSLYGKANNSLTRMGAITQDAFQQREGNCATRVLWLCGRVNAAR
jgi:hypothetical protein